MKTLCEILPQLIAVSIQNLLLLEFGLTVGFPTILIPSLSGKDPTEKIRLDSEETSWISSIFLLWISIGCLVTGPITQIIGRKACMQLLTVPYFVSWMTFYFSNESWNIFAAISIFGFTGGILTAPVMTYVAEVTQPNLRGVLTSASSVTIQVGFLLQFLLGTFLTWRQVALINSFMPLICCVSVFFIPETPLWLLTNDKPKEAKKSLAWLRGWTTVENVEKEFLELTFKIKEEKFDQKISKTFWESLEFFIKKEFYVPFALVGFAFGAGYGSGTSTVTTYAISIFTLLRTPINEYYVTVILGLLQLIGGLFCVIFINFLGKRVMTFISLLGVGICSLNVAVYVYLNNIFYIDGYQTEDSANHWIPVIFLVLSSFFANVGVIFLPWILVGEVFPNEIRTKSAGVASAFGFSLNSLINKIFPNLISLITLPGVFLIYGMVALLSIVLLYFILPETEGKSLHEISDHFKGKTKIDNKVKRVQGGKSDTDAATEGC